MALDFPDSPSNGDYYNGFVYDSTSQTWRVRGSIENPAGVSATTGSPTITTVGDDTVYKFTASGSITVDVGGFARVLVVGGGGGGANGTGSARGGGGGAGGYVHIENHYLPAGTHTVTVGAGGENGAILFGQGYPGEASRLGSLIVPGGGPGGRAGVALRGASGGGVGYDDTGASTGGDGIPGLGNDGGDKPGGTSTGAGGGGAGSAGVFADGAGGDGIANDITGSSVTYAAGGNGAISNESPSNAAANTGNGGDGGGYPSIAGADGGSGVVIVRIG